jgi:soluble lytic murein transglycosylase
VVEWIELNGDPRVAGTDIVDWIELIPFSETRNYVQRVVENTVLYRARIGGTGGHPHPLAPWLR